MDKPDDKPGQPADQPGEPAELPVTTATDPASGDAAFAEAGVPEQAPAPKKGGKGAVFLALLALLVALAVAGEAGWRWYLKFEGQGTEAEIAATNTELQALEARLASQQQALERTRSTLEQADQRQGRALAEARQLYADRINALANAAPPSPRDWRLAEVEYLLRVANHRVRMERDTAAGISLLDGADAVLRELDDYGLFPVRELIATEVAALKAARGLDSTGLYLRLQALAGQVPALPRKAPEFAPETAEPEEEQGVGARLAGRLAGLVQFRGYDQQALRPLLAPQEAWYLEQNLRLMLEQAQLALLRRNQVVWKASLRQAAAWVVAYHDPEAPQSQVLLDELGALAKVDVAAEPPDISGSLLRLRELREAGVGDVAVGAR